MRSRTLAASLSAALVLTGGALAGAEEVEEPSDGNEIEFSLLYRDAEGDANGFLFEDVLPVSEDSLDLTEGAVGFDHESQTLIFRVGVLDLSELPPPGATGKIFYVNFNYEGRRFFVNGASDLAGGYRFGLGGWDPDTNLRSSYRNDLEGTFDYEENIIEIHLPSSMLEERDLAPLVPGIRVTTTDVLAQRYINAVAAGVTPTADTAIGRSFTIPEPPVEDEAGDEELGEPADG
jgi:hypothetical protein